MKANKNYNGVTKTDLERGFSDTMTQPIPPSDQPYNNLQGEMQQEKEGFLERQNVYERI